MAQIAMTLSVNGSHTAAAQVGADMAAGSLIKSPGGTIVPGGGYIAGRAALVAAAAARLTAPGVGVDAGCVSGGMLRLMFQGAARDLVDPSPWPVAASTAAMLLTTLAGRACGGPAARIWMHDAWPVIVPSGPPLCRLCVTTHVKDCRCEPEGGSRESGINRAAASRSRRLCCSPAPCPTRPCARGATGARARARAGLFLAPQMVGEALKGGRLVAAVMAARGFRVAPPPGPAGGGGARSFITAVELRSAERMVAFCRAVQRSSPVGAYVQPEPGVRVSP